MRKVIILGCYVLLVMGLLLSGCGKQQAVIAIPPSVAPTKEASIPSETIAPTPDMPSSIPEVSAVPVPSVSPSPSKPATSSKPSAAIPSFEKSASKAPTKAASNSIRLSNSKGSASLQLGVHAQTVLPAYGALSNMQPTQESIDWVADFPENIIDEFSDGYYGGPAPGGDINHEITLHFRYGKLDLIEIRNDMTPLKTNISVSGILMANASAITDLEQVLGTCEVSVENGHTYYNFLVNGTNLGFGYNAEGKLISFYAS